RTATSLTQHQQILMALMKNTQSVVSSRIFRPSWKKIYALPRPHHSRQPWPIKHTGIKWLCGSPFMEKIYMKTGKTHPPESIEKLAERIFTDLHQTIISHESGSVDGGVGSVHDMRVTVRRLRVALNNFAVCVPKEDRKRLLLRLGNLADALGGVRDLDVMI